MKISKKVLVPVTISALSLTSCTSVTASTNQEQQDHTVKVLGTKRPGVVFLEHKFELSDGRTVTCIESTQSNSYGAGEGLSCDWASAHRE